MKNRISTEHLLPCMRYLHGLTPNKELQAACFYEYARESLVLQRAARVCKMCLAATKKKRTLQYEEWKPGIEVYAAISGLLQKAERGIWRARERKEQGKISADTLKAAEEKYARVGNALAYPWYMNEPWNWIWSSVGFPEKSWHELADPHRKEILLALSKKKKPVSLKMHDASLLDASGVFDEFKDLAARNRWDGLRAYYAHNKIPKVYPICPVTTKHRQPWVHALLTLDLSQSATELQKQFGAWLDLPEIAALRDSFKVSHIGKGGEFKDRLKDLSAWRIQRGLKSWVRARNFTRKNRLKEGDQPLPFHDARTGQGKEKTPLNEAPLYVHESGWPKAKGEAEQFLAEIIPWEFGESHPDTEPTIIEAVIARLKEGKVF